MSTKSRKSLSSWLQCDKCQTVITQKDLSLHEVDCPPSITNSSYSFIRDEIIHTKIEVFNSQELPKNISERESNDMVFISQSALQLCNIAISDPVVVVTNDEVVVKIAFPTSEKSLTSVSLTKHAIELNNLTGSVKVNSLNFNVHIAKEIIISQLGKPVSTSELAVELDVILKNLTEYKIFTIGNKISVPFYGKKIVYKIVDALIDNNKRKQTKAADENDLSQYLKKISLTTDTAQMLFYKALYTTKWTILNIKDDKSVSKKTHRIEDIGGYDSLISEIKDVIETGIGKNSGIKHIDIEKGVLLYGPTGVGKSLIANAIITECNVNAFTVYGSDICSKSLGETENKLKEIFNKATSATSSIILLENMESLCSKKSNSNTDHERKVVAQLVTLFDELQNANSNVLIIAVTSRLDAIDNCLRRPGRLEAEFEIYVPTPNMRLEILKKLISKIPNKLSDEDVRHISFVTHGYVGADMYGLCKKAIKYAAKRQKREGIISDNVGPHVTIVDFNYALSITEPSAMNEVMVEIPNVRWSDIGGQKDLKLKLKQAIEWPLKHPEAFVRMGITPARGVLMFGPPGCSKTMIAKALATESRVNFLNIKGPELFSKWVGESERAVREVFRKARQVAPSIIFIDEIDALGGERGSSSGSSGSNVQERVLAQLLTELDGVTDLGSVTLVAATNRPDKIDKALLRPGRLDHIIYVGLPDEETRQEILEIKLQKMPISEGVNITDLVCLMEGYTGAEIQAVCHQAAMKALEEDINAVIITKEHFRVALKAVAPRTPISLINIYEDYINKVL